jgi:hypothetical protein
MAKVKPLITAQLQAFQEGLSTDLTAVLDAQANAKRRLDELSAPAYLKKYTPETLAEMRREQTERHAQSVLKIILSLPGRKRIIEEQREYWEVDFWRDAQLYPPPPEIKIGDSLSLLRAERDVQTLAQLMAFSSHTQMENTGRLWLTRELELMDADAFVQTIEEASAQGNAATVYLANLLADTRSWRSDVERGRIQVALAKAENEINLPQRTQALDILQESKELILDIESAYKNLTTGKEDLRSKIRPIREERKAREAAEKAAEEERKRNLQAIEENLILKGAV